MTVPGTFPYNLPSSLPDNGRFPYLLSAALPRSGSELSPAQDAEHPQAAELALQSQEAGGFSAPPMSSPLLFRRLCTSASENHHEILLSSYLLSNVHPAQFLCLPVLLPEKPPSNFPEFRSFYHAALYAPTVFL